MLPLQITILVIIFALLLLADIRSPLLSAGLLFFFFMWGALMFDYTAEQKLFYPIGIVFFLAVRSNMGSGKSGGLQTNQSSHDFNGSEPGGVFSGLKYHMLGIALGLGMIVAMYALSVQKGQFLGVAQLSVAGSGVSSWITAQFAPAVSMALGFIENRMFITLLALLVLVKDPLMALFKAILGNPLTGFVTALLIPLLIPLAFALPVVLASVAFGLFHMMAYNMMWNYIIWAALVMGMWIGSYYLTGKDTTAMDTSHGGWNGYVTAKQSVSLAIFGG